MPGGPELGRAITIGESSATEAPFNEPAHTSTNADLGTTSIVTTRDDTLL
jgi:hypothetical protein